MTEDATTGGTGVPANRAHAWSDPDRLARLEALSKILAALAIPIVLAIGGWVVQQRVQTQTVSKDYVQLAVSILREPDASKVTPELREWAVDLLNAYSAVKLGSGVSDRLKSGATVLPPLETFSANPSAALTPQLDAELKPALLKFQEYLKKAGFKIAAGDVKYEVVPGDRVVIDGVDYFAVYDDRDKSKKTLKVAAKHLGNFDLIRHEYMRHVLATSNGGVDTRRPEYHAVNSGLAVFFPCSFNGRSTFASSDTETRVELDNQSRFGQRPRDIADPDRVGNLTWGGAFWELRQKLNDPGEADGLLATAWTSWRPSTSQGDPFLEFVQTLVEVDRAQHDGRDVPLIQEIFKRRGLKM
jgi:hypothetical protein